MTITEEKRRFLTYEFSLLTIKAALSTRNKKYPIYCNNSSSMQKANYRHAIRKLFLDIESIYMAKQVPENDHIEFIVKTANSLSSAYKDCLFEQKLRIGVAQKLINLYLKYLWAAELLSNEPPHCPIDGIIRNEANIEYNWISSDCINEYKQAVMKLKAISEPRGKTLAQWELEVFRRRDDNPL